MHLGRYRYQKSPTNFSEEAIFLGLANGIHEETYSQHPIYFLYFKTNPDEARQVREGYIQAGAQIPS